METINSGDLVIFTDNCSGVSQKFCNGYVQMHFGFHNDPFANIMAGETGILLKKSYYEEVGECFCEILIGSEVFFDISSKFLEKVLPTPTV